MTEKSITKAPSKAPDQPTGEVGQFIQQALQNNASPEALERLFSLWEKGKATQAREAFVKALAAFQSECPIIEKTKKVMNKDGRTVRYQYAPLDSIVSQIRKILAKNGLSYTWEVKNEEGFITAVARATHELGHSEVSEFKVPVYKEGYMSAPQKYASALTFAKRYSLCNVLGISTGDEDTDATDVGKEKDAKSIKSKIVLRLRELGYETNDKKVIEETVKKLTKLSLIEKNYAEIASRLGVLVEEMNGDQHADSKV